MVGLNKVFLIGNVGTEPEMRYLANGTAVTSFRIATNRTYTTPDGERKQETDWFTVVTWNKLAETCNQYLSKGRRAFVEGRLKTRNWEGQDGQKRYATEIVATTVIFLDRQTPAPLQGEPSESHETEDVTPDEIPF